MIQITIHRLIITLMIDDDLSDNDGDGGDVVDSDSGYVDSEIMKVNSVNISLF